MKRFTLAIILIAIPFVVFAQKPGTIVLAGGAGGWGSFPVYASVNPTSTSNAISFWGWGGSFLSSGLEMGPYLSLDYAETRNNSTQTDTTSVALYPGIQVGFFGSREDVTPFLRFTTAVKINYSGSSSASSGGSTNLSVPGLFTQVNAEMAVWMSQNAALALGPTLNMWFSLNSTYFDLKAGFDIAIIVMM
jgi:hypothetical protein